MCCANSAVSRLGDKFGHTDAAAGKRVVVEHTSSNPNAPLHIGNLRNVMIGAHLARLLAAVGYQVTQAFYVNDLGAQARTMRRDVHGACVYSTQRADSASMPTDRSNRAGV